uniref:Uncharacterized protein n=1 Tax=Timema shepardi TaxID=629360 RepID=A0A7R9B2U3_TIMSH|nr:unnamed protein product [Timema shepardi]
MDYQVPNVTPLHTFEYASYIDRLIRVINRDISVEAENRLDLPDLEQDFTLSDGSSYQVTFTDRHVQGFSVLIREGEVTEDINGESGQAITITATFRLPGVPLIYSFSALATNGSTVSGEIEIEVEELLLEAVVFLDKESDTSYQASAVRSHPQWNLMKTLSEQIQTYLASEFSDTSKNTLAAAIETYLKEAVANVNPDDYVY